METGGKKIYVASSWRNAIYPSVVRSLRQAGHEVYDFRAPGGGEGFQWEHVGTNHQEWSLHEYREALSHPHAEAAFRSDFDAMRWADLCVLVLPCGRSAHAEAGWMKGAGKEVVVYHYDGVPELMYKMFDAHFASMDGLLAYIYFTDGKITS